MENKFRYSTLHILTSCWTVAVYTSKPDFMLAPGWQSPSCSSPSWDGSGMGPWTEPQLTVAGSFLVPHTVLVSIMNDHRLVDLKATDTVLSQCLVTASILGLWPHRFSLWPLSTQGLLFCSQISMCLPPIRVHARVLSRFSRAPLCATSKFNTSLSFACHQSILPTVIRQW